ncbi:hypothetical protein [Phaeovulum veldkampii]|uniref:hypothetical protein n=1 Tax=Phaeovulum veldkampii TaxID=33049 RepID=UPI0010DA39E8|nr:hypothetical protein [Phaeovulum veldkampii]TDQ54559.1 hypothetical protein EV658_1326 [Phaeovulum veldkampii DSM 11550]
MKTDYSENTFTVDLCFPEGESLFLRKAYTSAHVILEYGSGGSSILASEQPGKLVFSVESDRNWAIRLQAEIDARDLLSPAHLYHVDIGPTGEWGRPVSPDAWTRFHRYPLAIWDEPFFRQPDVVLIDGRFRPACFMAVLLRTRKPVTVLFDDYTTRPAYHSVEDFLTPSEIVGRMAVFEVAPRTWDATEAPALMDHFFRATYHGQKSGRYEAPLTQQSEAGSHGGRVHD